MNKRILFQSSTSTEVLKMGHPRPLFRLFSSFSYKHYNSYNKNMWKMLWTSSHSPGIRPTNFGTRVPPITTRPGVPAPSTEVLGPMNSAMSNRNVLNEIFELLAIDKTITHEITNNEADIAPWFRLHLPSCGPRFESQAYYLCFCQFKLLKLKLFLLLECEKGRK